MEDKNKKSKLELIFADDIMTDNVAIIKHDMNIGQVAHFMLRARVSGCPVIDQNEKVIGLITLTDLFKVLDTVFNESATVTGHSDSELLIESIQAAKNRPITEVMTKDIHFISPDTSLSEIIGIVVKSKIHTFPVMEQEKLIGIIGRHDILNATFVYG
ncbi:MAG: CBS domain-containing protein [Candidatus Omnitrophica bacterium]|nr:CBS domain-containing protein [Candidatus Omnitrophota bacterium]